MPRPTTEELLKKYFDTYLSPARLESMLLHALAKIKNAGELLRDEPEPVLKPEPEPELKPVPEPKLKLEPEPELKLEPEPELKLEPEPESRQTLTLTYSPSTKQPEPDPVVLEPEAEPPVYDFEVVYSPRSSRFGVRLLDAEAEWMLDDEGNIYSAATEEEALAWAREHCGAKKPASWWEVRESPSSPGVFGVATQDGFVSDSEGVPLLFRSHEEAETAGTHWSLVQQQRG